MESVLDPIEFERGTLEPTHSTTRPITTAASATTNVDHPLSPYAPWKDIGNESYSSEHESETLSASCTEPTDNWLASPATTANTAGASETKGSKDGLPAASSSSTFYYPSRPRTITLLLFFVLVLVGTAFQRGSHRDLESDIWEGLTVASFVLLTVGVLVFPTGPFTYPHPVVWRLLFGVSVLYLLALDFALFQRHSYVRAIVASAFPDQPLVEQDVPNSTAAGVSDEEDECALSFRNVWTKGMDRSSLHQTACWMIKAVVVRDSSVLWVLNCLQALTEAYVRTLLPPTTTSPRARREEGSGCSCWWQTLALDPFVFNALGIQAGMHVCKKLEMMELQWDEIISLKNTAARLKRAVLRFTPEAWSRIRWLDLDATHYKRFVGAVALLLGVQLMDLNGIYLQYVFRLPPRHSLVVFRLVLLPLIGAPSVQQLYLYITGRSYGRLGSQCWVYFAIVLSELVVLAKFGKEVMSEELRKSVALLMAIVVLSSGAAIALLAVCQHKGFVRVPSYRRKKLRKKRRTNKN